MLNATHFIPLVWSIAGKMKRRLPMRIDVEDLSSAGMIGLMTGLKRYRSRKGHPGTYLAYRIRGAMMDFLRDQDHLSRVTRTELRRLEKKGKPLGRMGAHSAAPREIIDEDHFLPDPKRYNPAAGLEMEDVLDWIRRHAGLRAALVFKMRFVDHKTAEAVGEALGVSASSISIITTKAMKKLRAVISAA